MANFDKILYGAAYYNEYHQERITDAAGNEIAARTDEDFALMREAGLSVIRVGESVWHKWQPSKTQFNLDWLQPILDKAHANGIKVIVGTPTYAAPRWVFQEHPEVIAHRATGAPIPYGHRQNVDYSSQAFRDLCEPLIRKMVARYADHPAIIGWQVDNEPGAELLHNDGVFKSFIESLKAEYGSVENLNAAWGLTYWSHALNDFDELWRPDGNTNPSYLLAWRRHQARITDEFLDWQRQIVRSLISGDQFITTCVALNRPGMDTYTIGESLDVTSVNVYYASQDGLAHPTHQPALGEQIPAPMWVPAWGASSLNLICDTSRGIRQENFLVTETNGSSISQGPAMAAFPHYPGQFKQAAINMVSRGAELVEYWHWHTLPYGIENHWGGVLPHSLKPGRSYEAFVDTAQALKKISKLGKIAPASEVALVSSTASRWAFEFQGPLRQPHGWVDPLSYEKTLNSVYEIAYSAGLGVQVFGDNQLPDISEVNDFVAKYPILILHSTYVASDDLLAFARKYAEAGGVLLVTPRSGFTHENGVVRLEQKPAGFADLVGGYDEYSNLTAPIELVNASGDAVGQGYGWFDEVHANDLATVELQAKHPFFSQYSALTSADFGAGTVYYLATYPDAQLAEYIGQLLAKKIGFAQSVLSNSNSVVVNRASLENGQNAYFVFNWSWKPAEIKVDFDVSCLLSQSALPAGQAMKMGPWSVEVLVA